MKNKQILIVLFVFSIVLIQCKKERNKESKTLKKEFASKNKKGVIKDYLLEGIYFPDEFSEDCDFWLKIDKEEEKYLYIFFKGSKVEKKGELFLKDKEKEMSFSNEFNGSCHRDTILIQNYGNSMNYYERIPYCSFKYISLIKQLKVDEDNLVFFNDKAYFLEQSGLYEEAVYILEVIIKEFPNRTVAYINLGDAYWGLGKKEEAKQAYKVYIEQMKAKNKESKIPSQVLERIS
ncbi:tetratricopeptide repeat protein [Tenacibaculum sp. SDUM215027]|uniref:tetratricopeptide repeat protein n=1 Tax=Tenacibaculum sp. SDUM215027 TaxID=3422596 RepID=UPI003D316DC1